MHIHSRHDNDNALFCSIATFYLWHLRRAFVYKINFMQMKMKLFLNILLDIDARYILSISMHFFVVVACKSICIIILLHLGHLIPLSHALHQIIQERRPRVSLFDREPVPQFLSPCEQNRLGEQIEIEHTVPQWQR